MMPSKAELMRLLSDWRRLTEGEGRAIANGDWTGVADHQARKTKLQDDITRVLELCRREPATRECSAAEDEQHLQPLVRELMALESHNRDLLVARRQVRQAESQRLAQTVRDLHNMRRAYGASRGPFWQSYS